MRGPARHGAGGSDSDSDSDSRSDADAGPNADTDADAGSDADADAGPDAGSDAGPDADADAGPDAGSDAGPDADADADAGPDAGSGSRSGSEPRSDRNELLLVGRMVKPHGLKGDVIVSLSTNRDERVAPGSVLTTDDGREFRVARSSAHQGRFIVTFDGVNGIDAADELRGTDLYAPPLDDPDALWVHDLIGAMVMDTGGAELGTVAGVEANPASDLLVLGGGALIPLRFVVASVPGESVTVDVPDGLLDLA